MTILVLQQIPPTTSGCPTSARTGSSWTASTGRTVEHYFQAAKFFGTDDAWAEQIRQAATPSASQFAWAAAANIRFADDWERVKDDVMRVAVRCKFETHADLREQLLATRRRGVGRGLAERLLLGARTRAVRAGTCWAGF